MSTLSGEVTWVPQNPPFNTRNAHWDFNVRTSLPVSVIAYKLPYILFQVTAFSFGNIKLGTTFARTDTGSFPISLPLCVPNISLPSFISYSLYSEQFFDILHEFNGTFESQSSPVSDGFLCFPSNMTSTMPPLNITLGSATFSIPSSSYIIPRDLYPSLNLTDDPTLAHSWLTTDGPGMFGLGQKWLEHVYTVYDSTSFLFTIGNDLSHYCHQVANNRMCKFYHAHLVIEFFTGLMVSGIGFAHPA